LGRDGRAPAPARRPRSGAARALARSPAWARAGVSSSRGWARRHGSGGSDHGARGSMPNAFWTVELDAERVLDSGARCRRRRALDGRATSGRHRFPIRFAQDGATPARTAICAAQILFLPGGIRPPPPSSPWTAAEISSPEFVFSTSDQDPSGGGRGLRQVRGRGRIERRRALARDGHGRKQGRLGRTWAPASWPRPARARARSGQSQEQMQRKFRG
jgi:hypothetical protein